MQNFKFICSDITDPQFNIASEEYLLKHTDGYYVYLWQNSPSVIVGSNQNTLLEVNLKKADELSVKTVRRLTGGGAVYHDLGNICYTIIAPYAENVNAFRVFSEPLITFLQTLGITAEFSGRNDVLIDGKKISGTAQVVYKDRVLHHGTILFDTDLTVLGELLTANKLKTESKGVKSVKSRVTNVKDYLKTDTSVKEFFNALCSFFSENLEEYKFTDKDNLEINNLVNEKYSTYEWNIGYSPKGNTRFDARFSFGTLTLTFDLIDGKISSAEIFGDFFTKGDIKTITTKLNGKAFIKADFENAFENVDNVIVNAKKEEILKAIF